MENFQAEKNLVRAFYKALDNPLPESSFSAMNEFARQTLSGAGFPFNALNGPETSRKTFWEPLKSALRPLQHRMDMFFAARMKLMTSSPFGSHPWGI